MLVSYQADIGPVFDSRDMVALVTRGLTSEGLADTEWRASMLAGLAVPTQDLARTLVGEGYACLLVRSFAWGASDRDLNLVLWRLAGEGCALGLVDDEDRLRRL